MPGNIITENGWPECELSQCEEILVPGTNKVKWFSRAGDAATILTAWAAWFNRNVRSIEPADGHRNWWGWDEDDPVFDSNHKSGTAVDLCADELPWTYLTMPQNQVDIVERGLQLFEGLVFWGRHWNRVDEMHFQMNGGTWNNPRTAEFAQRLRNGYLNIFGPPDPKSFPLPQGYYYGPLEGPIESISGEYETDSQIAKDGLGRWQEALGLPVTKKWNDGATPQAATTLQLQRNWPPTPGIGYGTVHLGEWDAVIRDGWRLPEGWKPSDVQAPEIPLVKWGDYSHYQDAFVDDSYPYDVIAFRASIADASATTDARYGGIDKHFVENMKRARKMVDSGKLKKVIAYHFWVPGYDNWGTFKSALDAAGGVFPELAFMIDVEDGGPKWNIRGDQSIGVNDFIRKGQELFVNPLAASIYVNFTANPDLLPVATLPTGVKIVVPRYAGPDTPPDVPDGVRIFGHQYASDEDTPPFGPSDINQSRMTLSAWLEAWGTNGGAPPQQAALDAAAGAASRGLTDADRALLLEVRELLNRNSLDLSDNVQGTPRATRRRTRSTTPAKAATKRAAKASQPAPRKATRKKP